MRKLMVFVCTVAVISLAGSRVQAQEAPRRQGPPALMLLNRQAVRSDLKMTEEQARRAHEALVKQITAFVDSMDVPWSEKRAKMTELHRQSDAAVAEILTPEQNARLTQIRMQLQGSRAFGDPNVAKALGITDEQKEKLRAIHAEARREFTQAFQNGRPQGPDGWKAIKDLGARTREQAMNVLTDEQKARWKELTGAPVQGELHMGWFGARGRGPHCQG